VHSAFSEIDDAFRELVEGKALAATYGLFSDPDWWTLRRMRDFAPVRTDLRLVRQPAPVHREKTAAEVISGPAALAEWHPPQVESTGCTTRRDRAFVEFRTGGPHSSDRVHVVMREGRPAGLAIVRDLPGGRVVLDFEVADGQEDSARVLLAAVVGDGSVAVTLDWFSRSPWFLLAQRKGFRALPSDLAYLVARAGRGGPDAEWLGEHWRLATADVGRHALPAMLQGEEIVTSAPVGTLTGRERHA
jgi:hypothetical protein